MDTLYVVQTEEEKKLLKKGTRYSFSREYQSMLQVTTSLRSYTNSKNILHL